MFLGLLKCLGIFFPIVIIKDGVFQKPFDKRCPSQSTCEWQVTLGGLFDVVSELGGTKPTLLALILPILLGPANFSAKKFKVSLGLPILFLLDRVSKLATRELAPQSLDRRQISRGNVLYFSEIHKSTSQGLRSRQFNQRVACKL
jgi:hypothetical protein